MTRADLRAVLRLYLVTDPAMVAARGLVDTVRLAVAGGVTCVQLRDKHASDDAFARDAENLLGLLRPLGVPLVVNDRVEIARDVGADGIHVGQGDRDVREVRDLVGPRAIVGLSITNEAELARVPARGVDYLGIGPVFATGTKPDHDPPLGLHRLSAIARGTALPSVAIGGIGLANAAEILASGVDGIAVVSAICAAPDPEDAARRLLAETARR